MMINANYCWFVQVSHWKIWRRRFVMKSRKCEIRWELIIIWWRKKSPNCQLLLMRTHFLKTKLQHRDNIFFVVVIFLFVFVFVCCLLFVVCCFCFCLSYSCCCCFSVLIWIIRANVFDFDFCFLLLLEFIVLLFCKIFWK